MRLKAIRDLAQLADLELFAELELGLRHCCENAEHLMADVATLAAQGRFRSAKILQNVANEEAAKAMILLDVVRCPRTNDPTLGRQLGHFTDHLAKGLYVSVAEIRPCNFAHVREWIERERKEFYLDGPDGGEWIFTNQILTAREQSMYVDYVAADDAKWWHDPATHHLPLFGADDFRPSTIFRLVMALRAAGWFSAGALAVISERWRLVTVQDDMTIHELRNLNEATLRALNEKDLLLDAGREAFGLIVNEGLFPLYPLALRKEPVDKADLLDQRARFVSI